MTDYGPISTGFSRKPLGTILAEIEAALITEFGPGFIQTAETPMGQINGIFSEATSKAWELSEDVYQSLDPDQAEGIRLDILGRIRRIVRAAGESDDSYRRAITNAGQARIDIQDVSRAIAALDGVTYSYVWVRDSADELVDSGMSVGSVCIAVTGGDDDEIASAIRQYIAPGVSQYGSTAIESVVDGYCRTFRVLRPIDVPVDLTVTVRTFKDGLGCPPPSASAIRTALVNGLYLLNGENISFYNVRTIIEGSFSNVEVLTINGERNSITQSDNQDVSIGFMERASLASADVTITVA